MDSEEIMIDVLDLGFAEQHVLRTYKEQMSSDPASESFDADYDQVFDMQITRVVGRFITANGDLYVLVQGCGSIVGPVTDAEPLHLGVAKRLRGGEVPHRFIDDAHVTIFAGELRSAQAVMQVTVEGFLDLVRGHSSGIVKEIEEVS